ncbi:MAG: hypothetical protein GY913_07770 [Proteobacteria bacterium]|nr:hypothetical protein [Pseudomonadota bacterium]MCP4916809.1 hypothetical protein [Pseudomonadota bacterium]
MRAVQACARRLTRTTTKPPSERIHDNSLDVPALRARASELDAFELHRRHVRLLADPDRTMDMAALAERLLAPGRRRARGAVNEVANVPPDR